MGMPPGPESQVVESFRVSYEELFHCVLVDDNGNYGWHSAKLVKWDDLKRRVVKYYLQKPGFKTAFSKQVHDDLVPKIPAPNKDRGILKRFFKDVIAAVPESH